MFVQFALHLRSPTKAQNGYKRSGTRRELSVRLIHLAVTNGDLVGTPNKAEWATETEQVEKVD